MVREDRWLLEYAANVYSQDGEDGILAKLLEVVGAPTKWCVEFGAWDGKHASNTYRLIEEHGFSAVMIEGSQQRYRDLVATCKHNPSVVPLCAFVGFEGPERLDELLAKTPIPLEFDVLSIDIDGNDYHVWKAVARYRPRVVVIEYNPTVPSAIDFVQPPDFAINQGASLAALTRLGREKGYELVSVTDHNAIFVLAELFPLVGIADNSVAALRPNEKLVTYVFNGYDGTVFLRGYGKLAWHGTPYREAKLQHLPKMLRKFPDTHGPLLRFLSRHFRSMKKRGWL
jgi:hypothetical protein